MMPRASSMGNVSMDAEAALVCSVSNLSSTFQASILWHKALPCASERSSDVFLRVLPSSATVSTAQICYRETGEENGAFPVSRICLRPAEARRRAVLRRARLGPGAGDFAARSSRPRLGRRGPGDHLRLAGPVRARAQPGGLS